MKIHWGTGKKFANLLRQFGLSAQLIAPWMIFMRWKQNEKSIVQYETELILPFNCTDFDEFQLTLDPQSFDYLIPNQGFVGFRVLLHTRGDPLWAMMPSAVYAGPTFHTMLRVVGLKKVLFHVLLKEKLFNFGIRNRKAAILFVWLIRLLENNAFSVFFSFFCSTVKFWNGLEPRYDVRGYIYTVFILYKLEWK